MQGRVALLQFVPIRLKALKPKETDFEPRTLGQHLKKRRLELRLTQKQVAHRLGVNPWTVLNWEKDNTDPPVASMPAILQFLGHVPFPDPRSIPQRLLAKRRAMGWTIKEAAWQLRVDEATWAAWEGGRTAARGRFLRLVESLLLAPLIE